MDVLELAPERKGAKMAKWISTKEAAAIMGVSDRFVRMLAKEKGIKCQRVGWAYLIDLKAAQNYERKRHDPPPKN